MTFSDTFCIYGTGGHAKSVADVLLHSNPSLNLVFVDDYKSNQTSFWGFPITKEYNGQLPLFIAIGDNQIRKKLFLNLKESNFFSIISPLSYISRRAQTGKNTFIGNFAHIGPEVFIGNNSIINTAAIVEHGANIGNHCHISVNATISGGVSIGDETFIGTGASIINNIKIISEVTIGAGAVVTSDIIEPGTYVGVPARKVN